MPNLFAGLAGSPEETVDTPYFFLCTESASAPEEVVLGTVEACVVVYPDQVIVSGKSPTLRKLLVQSLAQTVPLVPGFSPQARYLNEWSFAAPDAKLQVARRLSLLQGAITCRMLGEQALTDKVVVQISNWRDVGDGERDAYIERLSLQLGFLEAFKAGESGVEQFHVWFYKDRLHVTPDVEHPHVN